LDYIIRAQLGAGTHEDDGGVQRSSTRLSQQFRFSLPYSHIDTPTPTL